ncbi:MAG: glycoside hydrolase family 127 protein, partial [Armatimonadetes bacterium]|nr:glycoside hydrolase family 127 protein [Armatimonadota bacterium]
MKYARLHAVPFNRVRVEDGFWAPRLETNIEHTLPHNLDLCERTGRIRNFAQAAGLDDSPFQGHYFHDSDVYKVLEGAAYCLALKPDDKIRARVEHIIDLIAAAQQPDGYLNTWFTLKEPDQRWADLGAKHELYCAGHLFEAAVAWYEALGDRKLLDVACRFADYIDTVFGPGKRHGVPGHEEIELALVRLWQVTGEERYRRLARFFVDERGRSDHRRLFGEYCQDHLPVKQQREAVGHCVRAMYLYSAVTDMAAMTADQEYVAALDALWHDIVERKMYVTGGIGVQGHGEGFARPYFLPNYDAYCETCAAIGMALWNQRMALLLGDARFADIVELELYNGALAGVSLDGTKFFYVNPLASHGNHHRQDWYGCACCPTNVVRFIPQVGGMVYATSSRGAAEGQDGDGLWVLQYLASEASLELAGGEVRVRMTTRYPWEGKVVLTVEAAPAAAWTLHLRVPGWCQEATFAVDGKAVDPPRRAGFAAIERQWQAGDTVTVDFAMPVRRITYPPEVEEDRGRRAFARGPVVYCFEACDNGGVVEDVAIAEDAPVEAEFVPDLLDGVTVLRVEGTRGRVVEREDGSLAWQAEQVPLTAIPYYAWDNRAPGPMVVWVRTSMTPAPDLSLLSESARPRVSASHCWAGDTPGALNDGVLPKNSGDTGLPRFTWWDHKGGREWVEYDFGRPLTVSRVEAYWFDDT